MASPTYQPRVNTSGNGWRNPPIGGAGTGGGRLSHQPRPDEEQSGPTGPQAAARFRPARPAAQPARPDGRVARLADPAGR